MKSSHLKNKLNKTQLPSDKQNLKKKKKFSNWIKQKILKMIFQ